MRLNANQINTYVSGRELVAPADEHRIITGLAWDSREVQEGFVYVALPGARVDGHDFVRQALQSGAGLVLVSQELAQDVYDLAREKGAGVFQVADTYAAVTDLARGWRGHLTGRVIALTGSVGKTTTKNLVRDVLSTTYSVWATKANQNNELGVPKTLLDADEDTQFVIVEMGMRGKGQLASLCEFVKPDLALVTNCGECHIELLGSHEAIAQAKAEPVAALADGAGVAVLNLDDERLGIVKDFARVAERGIKVVGFDGPGLHPDQAQAWASKVSLDAQGRPHFVLHLPDEARELTLGLRGAHNVSNACAAAALAYEVGVPGNAIVRGLEGAKPEGGRQEVLAGKNGVTIINDAYNANPDSMKAALSMFCAMEVSGRRFAVLGDMEELGDFAKAGHEGVGAFIATQPIDRLLCIGELARDIADAAIREGYPASQVICFATRREALDLLESELTSGDAVLCKASHSMQLDKIAKELTD